jgi:hypothetical protein
MLGYKNFLLPECRQKLPNFLVPRQRLSRSPLNVTTNIHYKSQLFVHRCRIFLETSKDILFRSTNITCKIKRGATSFHFIISNALPPSFFPSVPIFFYLTPICFALKTVTEDVPGHCRWHCCQHEKPFST